jgi:hypothetical protein
MLTYKAILEEIKDVPVNKLEKLHSYIHTLTSKEKKSDALRKKILSFSNAFSDMSNVDFKDFTKKTKDIRTSLFDRKMKI